MAADLAIKEPCRAATTGNIALSGLQTIDGVSVGSNNRVLVKAQSSAVNNGVYVAASGAWSRATDFDGGGEVTGGTEVFVAEGTANADTSWRVAGYLPVAIGTDAINFEPDFLQSGTGSVPRTLQDKARDILSIGDKGSDSNVALALERAADDIPSGGEVRIPRGSLALDTGVIFDGQRLNLRGEGPHASSLVFNPASAGAAIELNTSGLGGQAQSSITGLGFISNNNGTARTAIKLVNVANVNIERIGILGFGTGDSIGIHTAGRQMMRIRDCEINCASPIVIDANEIWETLANDYGEIHSCELTASSPSKSCIEMKSGTVLSNMSVRNTALVLGKNGVLRDDTSSTGASNHVEFWNIRAEQGPDPAGWSFDLRSSAQNIQNLLFGNVRTDLYRNGIRLSRAQTTTMINTAMAQATLLIVALSAGTDGNSIATTETLASGVFAAPTLFEGTATKKAHGSLYLIKNPGNGETVTIGATTYTFVNTLGAANHVKIGADPATSASNLRDAIIDNSVNEGVTYGSGTSANSSAGAELLTALDIEMTAGGFLSMIGCSSQPGGVRRIANGRAIMRVRPGATGAPIGPFELWDHFAPSVNGSLHNYETMRPVEHQEIETIGFGFSFPSGSTTLILPMANTNNMVVDVELVARAANGRLSLRFQKNGTITAGSLSADGIFATTATSAKIYPNVSGAQLQLLGSSLAAATPIRIEMRQ